MSLLKRRIVGFSFGKASSALLSVAVSRRRLVDSHACPTDNRWDAFLASTRLGDPRSCGPLWVDVGDVC